MTEQADFDTPDAADEAPENLETAAETAPTDETGETAAPADGASEEAPVRPREVIKGIHPELRCSCEECAPDYTELQWFNVDEQRKVKGQVMLFCGHTGKKYFSPANELQAWLAANPVAKGGRSRKDG